MRLWDEMSCEMDYVSLHRKEGGVLANKLNCSLGVDSRIKAFNMYGRY